MGGLGSLGRSFVLLLLLPCQALLTLLLVCLPLAALLLSCVLSQGQLLLHGTLHGLFHLVCRGPRVEISLAAQKGEEHLQQLVDPLALLRDAQKQGIKAGVGRVFVRHWGLCGRMWVGLVGVYSRGVPVCVVTWNKVKCVWWKR